MAQRKEGALHCEFCDFPILSVSKHIKTKGHVRREEFKNLECKWEELRRADASGSAAILAQLHTILLKNWSDNTLLFHVESSSWKDFRSDGPDEFRRLHRKDETKLKMQAMLDELEALYSDTYPELKTAIKMLRTPQNVRVRTYLLHLVSSTFLPRVGDAA